MNTYRIRATGALVNESEFRASHKSTSFPAVLDAATLDAFDADPVLSAPAPTVTAFQTAQQSGVVQDSLGNWVTAYTVTDWPQAQIDAFKAQAKIDKWEAIKDERDRRESGGVLVGTKWFHSDEGSRIKQLGLFMAGTNLPSGLQWKCMDGSFVTMTPTLAGQIFGASLASTQAIFTKAEQHKAAMEASANPAVYDCMQGWPTVFGE